MGVGPVGRAGWWNGEGEGGEGGEGGGGSVGTVYVCLMNRSPLRGRAACSQCFVVTQRPLYRESWAQEEGDEQKKKKKKGGGGGGGWRAGGNRGFIEKRLREELIERVSNANLYSTIVE